MKVNVAFCTAAAIAVAGAAQAQDWSGFYFGVTGVNASGTYRHYDSGVIDPAHTDPITGSQFGGFAGYNLQAGNLVYGVEIAKTSGELVVGGNPVYFVDDLFDIRGRFGYASGRALIFGTVGVTLGHHFWEDGQVTNSPVRTDGVSLGLGVDVAVTDRVFVGLAYQHVTLVAKEGEIGGFPIVESNDDLDLISLRVGMRF